MTEKTQSGKQRKNGRRPVLVLKDSYPFNSGLITLRTGKPDTSRTIETIKTNPKSWMNNPLAGKLRQEPLDVAIVIKVSRRRMVSERPGKVLPSRFLENHIEPILEVHRAVSAIGVPNIPEGDEYDRRRPRAQVDSLLLLTAPPVRFIVT